MKKIISLVISFVLVYSSILPSYAQLPEKIVTSVARSTQLASYAGRLGRASAALKLGQTTARITLLSTTKLPTNLVATLNADQIVKMVSVPERLKPEQLSGMMNHAFYSAHSATEAELMLYSAVPSLVSLQAAPLTVSQKTLSLDFYKSVLANLEINPSFATIPSSNDLELWAKGMAAISNLGLMGEATVAPKIVEIAEKFSPVFAQYTDVVVGRALLSLEAYKELESFIGFRTNESGELVGNWWNGLREYVSEHQLPVKFPTTIRNVSVLGSTSEVSEGALIKWSGLNARNTDSSLKATEDWVALRKNVKKEVADPKELASEQQRAIGIEGELPEVSVELPNLQLGSTSLPMGGTETEPVAESGSQATVTPTAASVNPTPLSAVKKYWKKIFNGGDNSAAVVILNKPQPLASQLRDIVTSNASRKYKEQALVRLYRHEDKSLVNVIEEQPAEVRSKISTALAMGDKKLGEALFGLYELGFFDGALREITSVSMQGSLVDNLKSIVSQSDWDALARSAYAAESVLPLVGSSSFSGSVPTVPEADLSLIEDTFRPQNYAAKNMSTPTGLDEYDYYPNNIPFYYRDSKGNLSAQPVGILSQEQASLFGRILSNLRLASQPGFKIPKGFVLALDEQGQWKFVMPKGNLSIVESNAASKKVLEQIKKTGTSRVAVDTPYSTTDLLAMAHMLENNPELNLELTLNTPNSLSQFLKMHAFFIGNDAGASLTGPFKQALKGVEGLSNTMANLVSGVGYATPFAGGAMMPTMSKWGNVKTTNIIYGLAGTALAGSLALGMTGFGSVASIPMWALAVPTVALVLGASLANSFIPTFLNFYKDPAARTAANLDFSTNKQLSRLALTGITAVGAATGLYNWTIVVPVALSLLGLSTVLFRNTPMVRAASAEAAMAKAQKEAEEAAFKALSPEEQQAKLLADQKAAEQVAEEQKVFLQNYKDFRASLPEMKSIKSRVSMVYASYAASLMVLGQTANEVLGGGLGQGFVALCMATTFGTRLLATKLVKNNVMTDDQLTGASLPLLAGTAAALALLPYSGPLAVLAGAAGILHYMATATPGQLDAARMQNIVTAEMQKQKQAVLDDESLTTEQKNESIALLTREEKLWSAQASKDYSFYNGRGLIGIGVASVAAWLFQDMGPQWTQDVLSTVSDYLGGSPSVALGRLLFGYTAGVATVNAAKNISLTGEFFRGLKKTKITEDAIKEGKITSSTFGIRAENADVKLADINKKIKSLSTTLVDYGVNSEQKMTNSLTQMIEIYNRLVALSEFVDANSIKASFNNLALVEDTFASILSHNDISLMLRREFGNFQRNMTLGHTTYIPEGIYSMPESYDNYVRAITLYRELDQYAFQAKSGGMIEYQKFIDYLSEAKEALLRYEKVNPADSARVRQIRKNLDELCKELYQQDTQKHFLDPKDGDSREVLKSKRDLRDILESFVEENK